MAGVFTRTWRALRNTQPEVTEAAKKTNPVPAATPERRGFEYGIPNGGLNVNRQSMGASTQTDRRTQMTQLYEAYQTCPWSWTSVNAIARTITAGGLVMEWTRDDGEGDVKAPPKPANVQAMERLFTFCNPREDIRQLLRGAIVDLLVFGDAYIEVVWVGNIPVALYSLDSPSMFPQADEHGTIAGYTQQTEFSQMAEFEPREVIHISLDSPRSGIFGMSPTLAALLPITAWLFAAATLKEIFRKGNPPNIHVDFPANASQNEINRWDAMYAARNVGPRNIGVPVITKGGAAVKEMAQGSVKEYLDMLDQKRDEILASYGVPPAQAGVIESGNLGGGTGESQRKMFITNTCQPIGALVLEKINYHLGQLGFGITDWIAAFEEVDMRDSKVIEDIRDLRIRNGSYTLNKARAEINEPPVAGGDDAVLIDRQNLVLWRDLATYSQANVASKAANTALEPEEPADGQPMKLLKPEPQPVPAALAAAADHPPGQPADPAGGSAQPAAAPDGKADRKPGKANPAAAGDGEVKVVKGGKKAAKKAARQAAEADLSALTEAWQATYRSRVQTALTELPPASAVVEHGWQGGDDYHHHNHHNKPDYEPAELGIKGRLGTVTVDPADVHVDHGYQRSLNHEHVQQIVATGRDAVVHHMGLLARRSDGSLWVVDGQHHTAAAVALGIKRLTYRVFASTGPAMEKRVYEAWKHWDRADNLKVRGNPQVARAGK